MVIWPHFSQMGASPIRDGEDTLAALPRRSRSPLENRACAAGDFSPTAAPAPEAAARRGEADAEPPPFRAPLASAPSPGSPSFRALGFTCARLVSPRYSIASTRNT